MKCPGCESEPDDVPPAYVDVVHPDYLGKALADALDRIEATDNAVDMLLWSVAALTLGFALLALPEIIGG